MRTTVNDQFDAQDVGFVETGRDVETGQDYKRLHMPPKPTGKRGPYRKTITVEKEAYCRARAVGMTIEEAIAASGVKASTRMAKRWEKEDDGLRERISELMDVASKNAIMATGLDRTYVITKLKSLVERCMTEVPVLDRHGRPVGEYKFDSSGANAALRMLGDTLQMFKPPEKKPEDDDPFANMSDEDITRLASEIAAQVALPSDAPRIEAKAGPQQVIDVQALPETEGLPPGG